MKFEQQLLTYREKLEQQPYQQGMKFEQWLDQREWS